MSSQCDKLAIDMLSLEEIKEERNNISSNIYELQQEINSKKEEYRDMLNDGDYDDIEDTLSEICSLSEEIESLKSSLKNYSRNSYY